MTTLLSFIIMTLTDIIVIGIIVLIIGAAIFYIIKEKKSGRKCIGCPYSGECSKKHNKKEEEHSCCCNKK